MREQGPNLTEAAPWIAKFHGKTLVVKIGGEVLTSDSAKNRIVAQLKTLHQCGMQVIVVHGAGKQVDEACQAAGIPIEKVNGRRITSPAVRDILVRTLAELNADLCQRLSAAGLAIHGQAENAHSAIHCVRRPATPVNFGEVGDLTDITPQSWPANRIIVLPSLAVLPDGTILNANADTVASAVAREVGAVKIIFLTSVPGIMRSLDDPGPISWMSPDRAHALLESESVTGGMRAKLQEALKAIAGGVEEVHIASGREPFTLLREIYTAEGCGTLIAEAEPS